MGVLGLFKPDRNLALVRQSAGRSDTLKSGRVMRGKAFIFLVLLLAACAPAEYVDSANPRLAPIYVSIVTHNEQPRDPSAPAYSTNAKYFMRNRDATVDFARMLYTEGVKYNFQSDWDFVMGVLKYDNGTHSTGDKNVLRYLVENLSFEVDPHAHETRYSYADVAHLHQEAGVPPSYIAGGFIAMPTGDSKLEYLWEPVCGKQFDCEWQAQATWGGGTSGHENEEDLWISGIWKPQDNAHFTTHSDGAPLPHVGGYMRGWDGLRDLLEHQRNGDLEPSSVHTQTIFVRQDDLVNPVFTEEFRAEIQSLSDETQDGRIRWVGLNEVLHIWETEYDCQPNLFAYN